MHHDIDITLAGLPAETPTWLRAEISHSLALLNALDELEQIADSAAFQRWFHTRLLPLFPCQYAIVGVITLENGQPRVDAPLLQQLPAVYQAKLIDADGQIHSPLLCQWLARPEACWLPQPLIQQHPSQLWREQLAAAGLHNVLAHGFRCQDEARFCFVALYNLPENNGIDYRRWLNLLLPNLQRTALRLRKTMPGSLSGLSDRREPSGKTRPDLPVFTAAAADQSQVRQAAGPDCPLSERERQIAGWLKSGKNNREIAAILKLSELTVKTHLQNIRAKLGVKTRAQIVASLWRWLGCLALPQMLELAECSVWRIYPGIVMPISSGRL
jgi:DNA-binding CsgD family transcriptional regulator